MDFAGCGSEYDAGMSDIGRRCGLLCWMMALLALSLSCADAAPGEEPAKAREARIVSTVPAATLNLVLIGAADRLVGVTKYDGPYLPGEKKDLPVVGDYQTMNYEQLVKLKPTVLVIQTAESRIPPRLKELVKEQGIELLNMKFDHVADIWTSVRLLGKAAGKEAEAEGAIKKGQGELEELRMKYKDAAHPKVLYLVSPKLMLMCGGGTFIDEMIIAAGGENVGAKAGEGFIETSRETLVKLAPEVLLIGAREETGPVRDDPRLEKWMELPVPAARNKRVYLVTDDGSQMASVNIGKNVRAVAELIHRGEGEGAGRGAVGRRADAATTQNHPDRAAEGMPR